MKQNNLLQPLGFDTKSEKVYRSLLSLADAPVSKIAKEAGLKRTSVYHVLENLTADGLVSSYISRGTTRYYAESPSKLKSFFEQKMIIAERLIPLLKEDVNQSQGKVKIRMFEGADGIRSISEEALTTKEKTILSIGSSKKFIEFTGGKLGFGARRRKKGIYMRSLRFAEDKTDTSPKRLQQTRILPRELEFPGYILIFGHKVGITIFEGNGFGFLIESKQFARMVRSIFDVLWGMSK